MKIQPIIDRALQHPVSPQNRGQPLMAVYRITGDKETYIRPMRKPTPALHRPAPRAYLGR